MHIYPPQVTLHPLRILPFISYCLSMFFTPKCILIVVCIELHATYLPSPPTCLCPFEVLHCPTHCLRYSQVLYQMKTLKFSPHTKVWIINILGKATVPMPTPGEHHYIPSSSLKYIRCSLFIASYYSANFVSTWLLSLSFPEL